MPRPKPVQMPPIGLPLSTRRLRLRLPVPSDAPVIARYFRDRAITRPIPLWSDYSLQDAQAFVRSARRLARRREGFQLMIVRRQDGLLVGGIGLQNFRGVKKEGHLGYWVGRPHWGNGYATEAASRLCRLAFGPLRLHRLETGTFPFNRRSMRVLRRLGFVQEGVERKAYRVGGRWVDSVRFGLLRDEFVAAWVPRPTARRKPV